MEERRLPVSGPLDLRATLGHLTAGRFDPTQRVQPNAWVRATRTPQGPATLGIEHTRDGWMARAWGPGSAWALAHAPDLVGAGDPGPPAGLADRPELAGFARRARGMRLARTHRVFEALVLLVLQQLVAGRESKRAFRRLTLAASERAPGPFPELWLPVGPEQLLGVPPALWTPLGIPGRHGETLRRVAAHADRLEEAATLEATPAQERLRAIRGIGPWTANGVALYALGQADAVLVGDLHLPGVIAFHLTGERHADDEAMLRLLAPYAGERGRVQRWIASGGGTPPRRHPRPPLRELPGDAARWIRGSRRSS